MTTRQKKNQRPQLSMTMTARILKPQKTERVFLAYMAELLQEDLGMERQVCPTKLQRRESPCPCDAKRRYRSNMISNATPSPHTISTPNSANASRVATFLGRKTDEEKRRYKKLEDQVMADPLRKSPGVITTLSKTADNKLKEAKKPVLALIDEACQSTELESLLVRVHNTETLLPIPFFLGDPKQLRATVKTHSQNTEDHTVNPFADHLIISFFERLWSRDFETYMFKEQYRPAEGLGGVFNNLFHGRKRTNAIYIYTYITRSRIIQRLKQPSTSFIVTMDYSTTFSMCG